MSNTASAPKVSNENAKPIKPLRWIPLLLILAAMPLLRLLPELFEAPSLPVMMLAFLGPAGLGVLILLWWCFASRAGWREKILGIIGVVAIVVVGLALIHSTFQGMPIMIMVLPTVLGAFGLGILIFSGSRSFRVPVALTLTLLTMFFWNLKQSEGVTGDFESKMLWRWEDNAEQEYLQNLDKLAAQDAAQTDVEITLESAEWPSFRGPNRDGVIQGVTLATNWDANPPKKVWRQKIGPGWSSFTVAGDRLFTQEQRGEEEAVVCLSADSGKIMWDYTYPSRFWEAIAGAGPRATPTIADEGLFALGAEGILVCLNATTGELIWQKELKKDAGREPPPWGFSSSPLVASGVVIVHAGGEGDKGVFAYDATNGDLVWSVASGNHSYSSAQLASFDGQEGVLMMTNDGLQFINVTDGKQIWNHEWPLENYRCLQPLVDGSSVLIATSLGNGTRRVDVKRLENGEWELTEKWTSRFMKPDYNDYVLFDGAVYGFDRNIFASIDMETGKKNWKRGRYGNGQVVLLNQTGQLLVVAENGEVVLLEASPEELKEVTRFQALEGKTWNHPVLINDLLYIRNAEEVACYQMPIVSQESAAAPALGL